MAGSPQYVPCGFKGYLTWNTAACGGDGTYTYEWAILYDDSMQDNEYPSVTSNALTWYIDASKGSFTVSVSVLSYIDAKQTSLHVTIGAC
jgi:hypothetical protein